MKHARKWKYEGNDRQEPNRQTNTEELSGRAIGRAREKALWYKGKKVGYDRAKPR